MEGGTYFYDPVRYKGMSKQAISVWRGGGVNFGSNLCDVIHECSLRETRLFWVDGYEKQDNNFEK